jgi:hypothetical protein
MEDEKITKEQEAKELTDLMIKNDNMERLEEMLKKREIEFPIEKELYRVRKPNPREKEEIRDQKIKKHYELRKDPNRVYEAQLIKDYEKKGVLISKIDEEVTETTFKIEELELQLAELGKLEEKANPAITELKINIYNLMQCRTALFLAKLDKLSESIENELLIFTSSYTCYLVLEKKEGDNWERVFKNFEDFKYSDNEELKNRAIDYVSALIYQISLER